MTDMILIYITCDSVAQAEKIGKHLLKKRLCGCINIIEGMHAIYFWPPKQNKLEESNETILLVKTLADKFDVIEREVIKLHSADTPCLIALPITNVAKKYYKWIKGEIK
jgi:periplasmic divalent cation tolerance protein